MFELEQTTFRPNLDTSEPKKKKKRKEIFSNNFDF